MAERTSTDTDIRLNPRLRLATLTAVHILCLLVYAIPITTHSYEGQPVLDETHIVNAENKDVLGTSSMKEVFTNDYWGRNMNGASSHKSWRPLSILSFRWLKGAEWMKFSTLTVHRLVNTVANAATAELVAIIAVKMFGSDDLSTWSLLLHCLVKLVFAFHPTHVEVTANAANRPHLLAVLCAAALSDPSLPLLAVMMVQLAGLLCSETFVFQMPAVCITMVYIQWRAFAGKDPSQMTYRSLVQAILPVIPRAAYLFITSVVYLAFRHTMDWLSIPEGLIRPAENPFFRLRGMHRVRNYLYVLSIHVFKSIQLDFVGFSHEYGFECIRELHAWGDPRIAVPILVGLILLRILIRCVKADNSPRAVVLWLWYGSWLLTLFPVSGFVKVGTFVSDRIVVASTVSYSILLGYCFCRWTMVTAATKDSGPEESPKKTVTSRLRISFIRLFGVCLLLSFMWYRVHRRSLEWMDWKPLMLSSLKSCPRSAKSNLEISKLYSGLEFRSRNLTKAQWHLEKAESIDPTYCDVHFQLAQIYAQKHEYHEMEKRMAKSLLCPFNMHGSMDLWKRYWESVAPKSVEANARLQAYQNMINRAIAKETELQQQGQPQWMGGTLNDDEIDALYD